MNVVDCAGAEKDAVKRSMDLKSGVCPECLAEVPVDTLGKVLPHSIPGVVSVSTPLTPEQAAELAERFKTGEGQITQISVDEHQVRFIAGNRPPQRGTVTGIFEEMYSDKILRVEDLEVVRQMALGHLLEVFDDLVYDSGNAELQNRASTVKEVFETINEMCEDNGF